MKHLIYLILLLVPVALLERVMAAQTNSPRSPRDSVYFRNGDILFGTLQEIAPGEGLLWSRTDSPAEMTFNLTDLAEVIFSHSQTNPAAASSNYCSVQLVNGDQLHGGLESFDGQTLTLDTWYSGKIQLPKTAVALVLPLGPAKKPIFDGPNGIEGWTLGNVNPAMEAGQWLYRDGAFYAVKSASIAKDVGLPEVSSFSFDLEWRGFFHIAVALYTEYLHPISLATKENEPKFGGFYSLQLNPFSANLLPVKQTEPLRYLGQTPLQNLAQKTSAHVDIRVHKPKRIIALFIDGVLLKQWTDSDEFAGTGTAIRFVHQGQGAVKISNIRVAEWDGQFEEPAALTPNKVLDIARLKNGDRVSGTVQSIVEGRMKASAAGTVLDIPIARVKQIEFADARALPRPGEQESVRAYFVGGGSVTIKLENWGPEVVLAESPYFGKARFKPEAFSRIVFQTSPELR